VPMLLTMPILFAFYAMLSVSIEIRGQAFGLHSILPRRSDSVVRRQRASALGHSCRPTERANLTADRNACSRSLSQLSSRPKRQVI